MARGLSETERAAYEAHIKSLDDQIGWLRATVESLTGFGRRPQPDTPSLPGADAEIKLWSSEEEEDIQEMIAAGLIDASEAERALEAAGALHTGIDYAPRR